MRKTTFRSIPWVAAIAFVAIVASTHALAPAPERNLAWPQAPIADPTSLGFTKAGLDALDARMKQSVADGDTAGMTIILIRHGQVADFKSFGQQTPDTPMALDSLFRIYSMSKPITGVAMMQLYEQGKWKLDDPSHQVRARARGPEGADLGQGRQGRDDADGKPVLAAPKRPRRCAS